jgi:hypothetical protein
MWDIGENSELRNIFWADIPKGRDLLEFLSVDDRIIMKRDLKKEGGRLWGGFISFRIRIGGRLLCKRYRGFRFHVRRTI